MFFGAFDQLIGKSCLTFLLEDPKFFVQFFVLRLHLGNAVGELIGCACELAG